MTEGSEIARVATSPREGDVVKMRGGYVEWRVEKSFTLSNPKALGFWAVRSFKGKPDIETLIGHSAWHDLVLFGASSVESAEASTCG